MKNQDNHITSKIKDNSKNNLSYHTPTFEFLNYLSEFNKTKNPINSHKICTEKYTIHDATDYFTTKMMK